MNRFTLPTSMARSPGVRQMGRYLQVTHHEAIGIYMLALSYCMENANEDGDLLFVNADDLADECEYYNGNDRLIKGLMLSGLIGWNKDEQQFDLVDWDGLNPLWNQKGGGK